MAIIIATYGPFIYDRTAACKLRSLSARSGYAVFRLRFAVSAALVFYASDQSPTICSGEGGGTVVFV